MGKETGFPSATKGLTSRPRQQFAPSSNPPPPISTEIDRERRMEISHFSHEHPLTLYMTEDAGEPCNGCSRPIFDLGYVCYGCGFLLHKKCVKLPRKVLHRLHPKHPLDLLFDSSETFQCDVCKKTGSGFAFQCHECKYIMDVTCFLRNQPYPDLPPLERKTRKLEHFSHNHTLTLCYLTQQSKRNCQGCEQKISGPAYCCKECDLLTLHKSCAQLPRQREHPFHPSHSFTLFTESPYPASRAICDACGKNIDGFVYHCDKCSFDLHLLCACLTPSLKHEKHDHLLTFFEKINYQVSCNSCGKSCRNNLYRCVSCNFNVHSTCLPFPHCVSCNFNVHSTCLPFPRCVSCNFNVHSTCLPFPRCIKHKHHPHSLTLKDSSPKGDSGRIHCAACKKKISPEARAYYCAECSYGVHLECVVSKVNSASPMPQIYINREVRCLNHTTLLTHNLLNIYQ